MSAASGWDVIVVGAGPAGSATAARLASAGHSVLLLDRDSFPRRKPCGECLSPGAVGALSELGVLDAVLREPHADLAGWRIRAGGRAGFGGRFRSPAAGIAIARERLDATLLAHAVSRGAWALSGVKVTDLLRSGGVVAGVRGVRDGEKLELRARLVVGADGLRSVVLRRLRLLRRRPRLRKLAFTARLRGVDGLHSCGELHLRPWGCVGMADIGEGFTNVTVVVDRRASGRVAGGRERFFDDAVAEMEVLGGGSRIDEVLATGPFDWPIRSAVADGALLVGDAAGYYDPFTGQGIYRALRGAELAAASIDHALRADDPAAHELSGYEEARRREFGPGERLQRVIEAVVSRPRLFAVAAAGLRRRPRLADALIATTGDTAPIRSLADPRLFLPGGR